MKISRFIPLCTCLVFLISAQLVYAQPGHKVDIKKPSPYEERLLKAEKTGDGKLKPRKRFFQNLTTHYNYYFNANEKLKEILERAKYAHRDDYSTLLSFYNYSIKNTRADSIQLDSIIYKSQTGLVMHDLRNDWTDELYLLWGAAYYFWDKLDSASMMFQFINYAFAEKEEDGYYIPVGTAKEGQTTLTIASKEKPGLFGRTTNRNDAFIWQIRTLTEMGQFGEAAGMLNTLRNDRVFPERLKTSLEEAQAYWFYNQEIWDSAATHLLLALDAAGSRQEKARWEYLAAQLFEKAGNLEKAKELYAQSIPHTTDPVMDVYARLNLVRLNKASGDDYINQNIAELLRMAKRDKYADYRDIIYFMAAQMEMERKNLTAAKDLLIKGSKYNNGNVASRNKAFLQIADLSYDQRNYLEAASFYDSLQVGMLTDAERTRVNERRPILAKIVYNERIIERQDSLQKIAAMPEAERLDLLAKMVKKLRKERGLKDEPVNFGRADANQQPPDLFAANQAKGEWYFYNTSLKTQGQQQFKQVWGNRPNADNWRRSGNLSQQMVQTQNLPPDTKQADAETELSVEGLSANLPLTPEGIALSNDSIKTALNTLGIVFLNEAEDYLSAIDALEALRARFPDFEKMDEVLFHLYYAYLKSGDLAKAEQIKNLLMQKHGASKYAGMAKAGKNAAPDQYSPEATKDYENVYNLFIEGEFQQAIAEKKRADSVYQTNHWQPQLLYIESVYYIQQREDSTAKNLLQVLATQEAGNQMGKKAENLLAVLSRRAEIERELAQYQMQNQPESFVVSEPVAQAPVRQPAAPVAQVNTTQAPVNIAPANVNNQPVLNKPITADSLMGRQPVADAIVEKPKMDTVQANVATTTEPPLPKKDSLITEVAKNVTEPPVPKQDSVVAKPPVATVTEKPVAPPVDPNSYYFDPNAQHYAVIVLDKVDPIFVNEARVAFARFTRENFDGQSLQAEINDITKETRLVLVGQFPAAQQAIDFVTLAKKLAATEIVPWLKADKYTFSIITSRNLDLLKKSGDWGNYKKFTDEQLPGKF